MMMNRTQRRALKRDAVAIAARLVARCYDIGPHGGLAPIESPDARAALCRAFEALLRGGGAPAAIAVTQTEAKGFPRYIPGPWTHSSLAAGFDPDCRACFSIQSATSFVGDDGEAARAAQDLALRALGVVMTTRGFPMGPAVGRAC